MEVSGKLHVPAALPRGKNSDSYWPSVVSHSRSGRYERRGSLYNKVSAHRVGVPWYSVFDNGNTNVSDEHVVSIFRVGVINGRMWAAHMCRIAADVVRQKRGTETDSGKQRWRHITRKICYHFQHYAVSQLETPHSECKPPLQLLMLSF